MNFKHLFIAAFAAAATLVSCEKEEDLGAANVSVDQDTVELAATEGSETITFTATRDWSITCPDWIAPSATSGKASASKQHITIAVEENNGNDRTGTLVISIGLAKASVTVTQKGAQGAYEAEEGDGSKDKPFNVAQACAAVKDLTYTDSSIYDKVGPYYIRGKVVSIKEAFSADYGNGHFVISDDGTANGDQFTCYRVLYLENKKWVEGNTQIQVGDVVVVYGELMNFKGNTPENVQKGSYLYSLNGETQATGGQEIDYNNAPEITVADLIAKADKTTYYKLTGTVSKFNSTYCSFDLTDATGSIYVYSVDNKADWVDKISNGATVTLAGKYTYYEAKSQHEIVNAWILSCEGGAPDDTDYDKVPAKTVAEFIAAADKANYYKLSGTVSNFNATYCSFDLTDATGTIYVYSVDNKADWTSKISNGGTVTLAGKYEYYEKKSQHEVVNAHILSFEAGQDDTDYENVPAKTVAEFINAADKTNYYKLTGTVSRFNATYCSFDLTDETGTIYVYSVDNKADWTSKISDGGTVTLAGKYSYYEKNSQHEVVNAHILSFEEGEVIPEVKIKSFKQTTEGFKASWEPVTGAAGGYVWMLVDESALEEGGDEEESSITAKARRIALRTDDEEDGEDDVDFDVYGYGWTEDTSIEIPFGYSDEYGFFSLESFEVGMTYYLVVTALGEEDPVTEESEDIAEGYASFVAKDMSQGGGSEVTVTFSQSDLAAAACKGAKVEMDDVISFTNSSDYGTTTVTELRIYKSQTLAISAAGGATITKIEFTCSANGTTKQGPGCWGTGAPEGYTFDAAGPTGTWEGSETSVSFKAVDNQVRIKELKVTYTL